MRNTRHSKGYFATDPELNAVAMIAQGAKMDESWFGEIVEAYNRKGRRVHVVKDRERNSLLSFRYAVKMLDEGILSPFDYVTIKQGLVFEKLLMKLGIVPANIDTTASWIARCAIADEQRLFGLMSAIIEEDSQEFRFRPMKIRGDKVKFIDISNIGDFNRSVCRWYCIDHGIPFEAVFRRYGKETLHYVYNGREFCVFEKLDDDPENMMKPNDIVNMGRKS